MSEHSSAPALNSGDRKLLALAVLICLQRRAMRPYEAAEVLRDRNKHERLRFSFGSLNTVIASLRKRGLIAAQETVGKGPVGGQNLYGITDDGAAEPHACVIDLLSGPINDYPVFGAALSFLYVLPPDQAVALLRERAQCVELELARRSDDRPIHDAARIPRAFWLDDELCIVRLETELSFVERLQADLESGSRQDLDEWWSLHDRGRPWSALQPMGANGRQET